eukprot:5160237-Alexandrium_andersonii.AAC.1
MGLVVGATASLLREWIPWPEQMHPPLSLGAESLGSGREPGYSADTSRRLALASYSLSLLARRRDARLWPGVL